ncbi:hypothetical protein Ddc_18960 [Ditylenchus destructor]|nr:hypothetical protein Ddc_18960 [Ditylenchus destructor]
MAKKATLQTLNPKPKGKVQKRKVQKSNMILLATSESLAEREYTYEQNMDVQPLVEGTDLNMIKQEEIKLETEASFLWFSQTMECDEVGQLSSNSVHITSEETVKNEPESFVVTEAVSNPEHAKTTVSIPARKQRKNVAKEKQKLAKEREKVAKEQEKRQNKRARNPARHEENIAQLPDYSEISQSLNQELSDTNLNDNADKSSDEIPAAESDFGTETQNLHLPDPSMAGDTSQEVDRSTNIDETESEVSNDIEIIRYFILKTPVSHQKHSNEIRDKELAVGYNLL